MGTITLGWSESLIGEIYEECAADPQKICNRNKTNYDSLANTYCITYKKIYQML